MASVIRILITGEAKGVVEAAAESKKALGEVETKGRSTSQKLASVGTKLAAGLATIAIAAGAFAVKQGSELQESQDQLKNALDRTGQSMHSFGAMLPPLLKQNEKWGYTNTQVYGSLQIMARAGIKARQSVIDETIAANIAKSRHMDLASATNLVAKASEGQTRALKALNIDLPVAAGGAEKLKNAQLSLHTSNLSLTQSETKQAEASKKLAGIEEAVRTGRLKGTAAAGALFAAQHGLESANMSLTKAQNATQVAQVHYNDSAKASSVIMSTLQSRFQGAADTAGESFQGKLAAAKAQVTDIAAKIGIKLIPILLKLGVDVGKVVSWLTKHKAILIALGLVVGTVTSGLILYAAVTKTIEIAQKLATVATTAWKIAQAGLNLVMDANPIVLVAAAAAALAVGFYVAYQKVGWFHNAVNDVWQFLKKFASAALGVGKTIGNVLFAPIKLELKAFSFLWNETIGKILHGQHVGVGPFKVTLPDLQIPAFANGALVSSPTLALLGEAGPEVVLPVGRPSRARQLMGQAGLGGSDAVAPIVQNIYAIDVHQAMRVAAREQAWASKTAGR